MTTFTKTETLRRLRVLAAESRRVGGLHTGYRVEIGHRALGVQHASTVEEARELTYLDGDDLADFSDMKWTAGDADHQQYGAVVHLYLSDPDPWGDGLADVNTGWLGTPDHEPVLLDYNGTDL